MTRNDGNNLIIKSLSRLASASFLLAASMMLPLAAPASAQSQSSQIIAAVQGIASQDASGAPVPHKLPTATLEDVPDETRKLCGLIAPNSLSVDPFIAELRALCLSLGAHMNTVETIAPFEIAVARRLTTYAQAIAERSLNTRQQIDANGVLRVALTGARDVPLPSRYLIAREMRITNVLAAYRNAELPHGHAANTPDEVLTPQSSATN